MAKSPYDEYQKNIPRFVTECPHLEYRDEFRFKEPDKNIEWSDDLYTADSPVLRLEAARLSDALEQYSAFLKEKQLIFVKSPKGTGKTQWLKYYLRRGKFPSKRSVLVIVHRQSLAHTLSSELDSVCYLDDKKANWRYVVSLDSIGQAAGQYDVVVIDEVEQVLRHIIGETTEENRGAILSKFISLIRGAKQLILCDADLTFELTTTLIRAMRANKPKDKAIAIVNSWKSDRQIKVYEDKWHLIAELVVAISEGKKVYIPVGKLDNLAVPLEKLMEFVRKPNDEKVKVLALTGNTSKEESAQAFFRDPNGEAKKYDVLIATSTLSTGVSIDCEHFDAVFGIFDSTPYTFQDCDQAISRVRKCDDIRVWIHHGVVRKFSSLEQVKKGPALKEITTRKFWMDDEPKLNSAEQLVLEIIGNIMYCEDKWSADREKQFIELKQGDGWEVIKVAADKGMVKAGKELLGIGKDPQGDIKFRRILAAETLSEDEFENLKDDKNAPADKKIAVRKRWIAQFYQVHPSDLSLAQVKEYHEQAPRDIVKNLRLMAKSHGDAVAADRYQRESLSDQMAFTDMGHKAMRRKLLEGVQQASGIDPLDIMTRAKQYNDLSKEWAEKREGLETNSRPCRKIDREYKPQIEELKVEVSMDQIDAVAVYVAENLAYINPYFATDFTDPTATEVKVKVFNTMMGKGKLGVSIKKHWRKIDGVKKAFYLIDYSRIAELSERDMVEAIR